MKSGAWQWGLTLAATGWAVVIVLTPALTARLEPGEVAGSASAIVYVLGSMICHQRPERSFHWWGAQLPVCARCTGLYLGAACAALVFLAKPFRQDASGVDMAARARRIVVAAALPTLATLIWEWIGGRMAGNWMRAASGLPLGAAIMWVILQTTAADSSLEVN